MVVVVLVGYVECYLGDGVVGFVDCQLCGWYNFVVLCGVVLYVGEGDEGVVFVCVQGCFGCFYVLVGVYLGFDGGCQVVCVG